VRLFVGLEIDPGARVRLAALAKRLEDRGLRGRYEHPSKYHVTLAFLGNAAPARLVEFAAAMHEVGSASRAFSLHVDRIGAFPNERNPRIVWAGCRAQPAEYRKLATALHAAYEALGLTLRNEHVAHVTLCRPEERAHLPMLGRSPSIEIAAEALALFESLPADGTTRYEVRERAPLAATTGG